MTVTYYGIDDTYGPEDTMANGEPFDPYAMTAASNAWPLGTWLKVCLMGDVITGGVKVGLISEDSAVAPANCVDVAVTDRCGSCSLDLSYGAFGMLAPHSRGVLAATVEVLP